MSYILLTVISALFFGMYDLFKKISLKKNDNVYEILFFYTFVAFLCGLVFIKDSLFIGISNILFILLKTFLISISWFLTMKAMKKLDIGIVVPFSLLGAVFTTINAFLFFKEKIGLIQIGGVLIILSGLLLLSRLSKKDKNEVNDYKYLWLLVLAAFLTSISAIIDKRMMNITNSGSLLFWFFFFLAFIYMIVCLFKNKKIEFKNIRSNLWVVLLGICIFLSDLFYYEALDIEGTLVSIVFIIKRVSVFISVVLASVFLKEKYFLKKLIILLFMFCGLGLILFL